MSDDIEDRKRALRAELRRRRRNRTASERESAEAGITARLLELSERIGAASIAAYLSTPDEPGTRAWLRELDARGTRVLLPISRVDGLLDWAPYDGEAEESDILGMPTPTSEILGPIAINEVDLIVVPAAAVDRSGLRMGWGRGYFDKTLGSMENCPPVYAVIFDDELIDEVPRERHDMPVDGVVTPSGIVELRA
ncbi:5-formyltetrahydrofolate cyclo-ligase [Homoserinibacter sp. YIM 151385]|uniref:5-formyltetrahydrofolate cyclo-ligase n=1 Tax=Homoserinibacter sp. YIM 151385 TaxID=2985506 RepID=UPI0022F01314|nr:5-formyltetrahydrofolate cyclo-ligase [Homoserinibacter sp. YIM 151385]WBU37909.1 5-formyltetrahydrofolate cyclo-ligase [Homoserinibacter sp. YIM 151385]